MKITLRDLDHAWNPILELGKLSLPAKVAYAIARNAMLLEPEVKVLFEQVESLRDKHGGMDNGYVKDLNELLDMEIEVDLKTISVTDIVETSAEIKPATFVGAWFLFEEES